MKYYTYISIIQTLGIIVLISVVLSRGELNSHPQIADPNLQSQNLAQQNNLSKNLFSEESHHNSPLTETQIREIIRSEVLAAISTKNLQSQEATDKESVSNFTQKELTEAKDLVASDIDFYIGNGELSRAQMNDLQKKIVQLDTKSRKQMFAKLFSAMNSGLIEGQL